MSKFNIVDIHSLQECLVAYKSLLQWIPVTCVEEMDLKDERLRIVDYLSDKCDRVLERLSEEGVANE
jgi:hypothetical protein